MCSYILFVNYSVYIFLFFLNNFIYIYIYLFIGWFIVCTCLFTCSFHYLCFHLFAVCFVGSLIYDSLAAGLKTLIYNLQ